MQKMAMLGVAFLGLLTATAEGQDQSLWKFDNLARIGGQVPKVEGKPMLVDSPVGKAIELNGKDNGLTFANRPLVGATSFTIEAVIRPEGGEDGSQRILHIAQTDPATGLDARPDYTGHNDPNPRIMTEARVGKGQWYLHVYIRSKSGPQALNSTKTPHPFGAWYVVAQTYDGKTYRSYVNGVLEGQADIAFTPQQGPGSMSVGTREGQSNFVQGSYFKGAIAEVRFSPRALAPAELLKLP